MGSLDDRRSTSEADALSSLAGLVGSVVAALGSLAALFMAQKLGGAWAVAAVALILLVAGGALLRRGRASRMVSLGVMAGTVIPAGLMILLDYATSGFPKMG
jgi:riboflavin transporter FmnP